MMDISHLYHDAAFGDPTLELDVKEQLKTREVNAREERNLQRMHKSYDKEMDICEKNTALERWKVGKSLQGIWERSPRLEKRLAREKARIEALERSILYQNFPRMNSQASEFSMGSRSVSRVTLKPLHDQRKTKNSSKKKEKSVEKNEDNNNEGNERSIGRQADFVRRSEHSIKALAKLNWKQQNRRRDHEKFKEDLFFHSKPVFERARVVLKGRPDVDVENLYTDLESILLPPVKRLPNFNLKTQSKNSNLSLYEKNILRLGDSGEKKRPPYVSPLAPVNENSESTGCGSIKLENRCTNYHTTHNNNSGTSSEGTKDHIQTSDSSSFPRTDTTSSSLHTNDTINSTNVSTDANRTHLPDVAKTPTSLTNNSGLTDDYTVVTQSGTSPTEINNKGVNTNDCVESSPKATSNQIQNPENQPLHDHQPVQIPHTSSPFSPSTMSISQVIIEEDEEDLEKPNAATGDVVSLDINNNSVYPADPFGMASDADPNVNSQYAMPCTTGLPQLWKQTKKPKEKITPEVSASALARKHKRKRRDRW